jgi:hypothetical protein
MIFNKKINEELFYISDNVAENNEDKEDKLEHLTINKGFGRGQGGFATRHLAKLWLIEDLEDAKQASEELLEGEKQYLQRLKTKLEQLKQN